MNGTERVTAAVSRAAAVFIVVATVAGCSQGPERDDETGELIQAADINVFDLQVGDCLDGFNDDTEISKVHAVPCAEEHTDEIMAAVEIPDDAESSGYPGSEAVQQLADEECNAEFERFVGRPWDESQLEYGYLAPTEESWADGDREILCTVGDPTTAVTGTLENANR